MEQKGLDEIEETFLGEEIIEDEVSDMAEKKATKPSTKKKATTKKTEEKVVEEKIVEEKVENKDEVTKVDEEVTITPVETVKETPAVATKETAETKTEDHWGADPAEPAGSNAWAILSGVLVVLLLISVFTQGFSFGDSASNTAGEDIGLDAAEELVQNYVNDNLLPDPFTAGLVDGEELHDLYKITLSVNGEKINSYVTKNGNLFFPQGLEIVTPEGTEGAEEEVVTAVDRLEVSADDDAVKGDPNAPVTIVEFSDYECPFCARFFSETYPQLVENYIDTGIAKLVFRDFPLSFHPNAEKAAVAAECAGDQGKYYEMHDLLFERQAAGFSDELYPELASELKLDLEEFNSCLEDPAVAAEVEADMAEGGEYGVSGTPAFFVNGEMLSGAQPYSAFVDAIERALAETNNQAAEEDMAEEPTKEEVVEEPVAEEEMVEEPAKEEAVVEVANTGSSTTVSLNAKRWRFTPSEFSVSKGDAVQLTIVPENLNDFTFSIEELGVEEVISGETVINFVASKTGSFEYSCSSCEEWRGMSGTLIVE